MIQTTDIYDAAKRAGAKPLIYLLLGTNYGRRCYGKETPRIEHLPDDVFQFGSRVLIFGDIRQSVASDSDSVYESLFTEEMGSCSVMLDNADGELSRIAGREIFLSKSFEIIQGFDTPDFTADDFISLFSGNVSGYELDKTTLKVNATQSVKPVVQDDPEVDTSSIYTLSNGGSGFTAAQDTYTYADTSPVFYTEESWEYFTEITIDTIGGEQGLFEIQNDGNTRFKVGVDDDGYLFLRYNEDATQATTTTLTSSVLLGADSYRVGVAWDATVGTVTFTDGKGQIDIIDLTGDLDYSLDRYIGSSGSGDGQFQNPNAICVDALGNIYVTDSVLKRVKKFDNDGTFLLKFGSLGTGDGKFNTPYGVAVDAYGNIYVCDSALDRVQKFDSSGNFLLKWGTTGTGDGEFDTPTGLTVNVSGNVLVADRGNHRVQVFSSTGTFQAEIGAYGSGNGEFNSPSGVCTDSLNNIYVLDLLNYRIQKFSDAGAYVSQFGTVGTANGEFDTIRGITIDASGYIYVSDNGNDRVQIFNSSFSFLFKFPITNPYGIAVDLSHSIFVVKLSSDTIAKFGREQGFPIIDFSDTGSDDDIILGEDFAGDSTSSRLNDTFHLLNDTDANSVFPDTISGLDLTVVDGTWSEMWTIDEYLVNIINTFQTDATDDIILPDSSRYTGSGPNQQNIVLPLLYGNTAENADQGVSVCPLINETSHVYCVSGWPILSVAAGNVVNVYVDGVLTPGGWTFDESNDYQSQGDIAILTFASDPGGDVTVSCKGKAPGGVLLTNPIDIIEDFIEYAAGIVAGGAWQIDGASFAKARNIAANAGYVAAGVIQSNNSLGYWIKSILKPFLGSFRFSPSGLLQVSLQPLSQESNVFEELTEYEAITVKAKQHLDNICGSILVNYAVSFATIDRRFKNNGESSYFRTLTASQTALNPQTWELDFDWCRRTSNIETVQNILLDLYADPEYIIDYQGQDFKFVPVEVLIKYLLHYHSS